MATIIVALQGATSSVAHRQEPGPEIEALSRYLERRLAMVAQRPTVVICDPSIIGAIGWDPRLTDEKAGRISMLASRIVLDSTCARIPAGYGGDQVVSILRMEFADSGVVISARAQLSPEDVQTETAILDGPTPFLLRRLTLSEFGGEFPAPPGW